MEKSCKVKLKINHIYSYLFYRGAIWHWETQPCVKLLMSCHMGTSTNCLIVLLGDAWFHTLRSVLQKCSVFSVVSEARGSCAWV